MNYPTAKNVENFITNLQGDLMVKKDLLNFDVHKNLVQAQLEILDEVKKYVRTKQ